MKFRKSLGLTFDDVLLVPQKTQLASRSEVDLTTRLTPKISLKLPIISANMDTVTESKMAIAVASEGGIGIIHRFLTIEQEVNEVTLVKQQKLLVGAAIGIKDDYLERTQALLKAGADVIVLDIAHGHSVYLIKALVALKKKFSRAEFIAGNVATAAATRDLIKAGATAVKVGIGPGAQCITRIVAGAGVPQLTSILDCVKTAAKFKTPIIADGGLRSSGDLVKALAAGASTGMFGTMFAGCDESPALTFYRNNQKFKLTRGMASLMANHDRQAKIEAVKRDLKDYAAEGVSSVVPYRGSVIDLLRQLANGVRSGFSYCGAKNIAELWRKAELMQVTQASIVESMPHDVQTL